MNTNMKIRVLALLSLIVMSSCATKKDILYLQDADLNNTTNIIYQNATIQPNDILKITVETLVPEAALPYNRGSVGGAVMNSIELIKLNGYLVSNEGDINFPILGIINVSNLTTREIETKIKGILQSKTLHYYKH